jgi:hypothetical protein
MKNKQADYRLHAVALAILFWIGVIYCLVHFCVTPEVPLPAGPLPGQHVSLRV